MIDLAGTKKIIVAMSGGVDSSVAASILQDEGLVPIGVTFRMLPDEFEKPSELGQPWEQAASVCKQLGIEHMVVDCREEFVRQVLRPAWNDYAAGKTPNPCVVCNPRVKFHQLIKVAKQEGAKLMATGHHAKIRLSSDGVPLLCKGADRSKDQSYFLYALKDEQLRSLRLPIGNMSKQQVRARAKRLGLGNADQADSQDACFSKSGESFAQSLSSLLDVSCPQGPIVDDEGKTVAHHGGIHLFTLGQRKALGVAIGRPAWVRSIDADSASVFITTRPESLMSIELLATNVVFSSAYSGLSSAACQVKIRSTHKAVDGFVDRLDGHRARVSFESPQRAVTPGQAVVFYDGEAVLGGGTIDLAQ